MASFNKVILMGNLTRDPNAGTLPSGTEVCEIALAVNRCWKDAQGNPKEEVLFIDCTAFGKTAKTLGERLRKGYPIHIEGHLKLEMWDKDGETRSKIRVTIEAFHFVGSSQGEGNPADSARQPRNASRDRRRSPARAAAPARADIPV